MTTVKEKMESSGPSGTAQDWLEGPLNTTLANLSHELKTPLNAILGHAQLLARDPSLSDKGRRRLDAIERSGQHLLELVNAFLNASAARAGELRIHLSPSSTASLVADVVAMFEGEADRKGIDLSYRLASDTPSHVLADIGKIRQILVNLVGNAVKYTDRGGVHVLVRSTNANDDSCVLEVEVMDTGPGIDLNERQRVFDRYTRGAHGSHIEGVGLGLAISQHNARLLGGSLSVDSCVGRGSVFRLAVPVTWLHYSADMVDPADIPESSGRLVDSRPSGTFQRTMSMDLQPIPAPLSQDLLAASRAGDASEVIRLAEQLSDADLSRRVRSLAGNFDYEGLAELVDTFSTRTSPDS